MIVPSGTLVAHDMIDGSVVFFPLDRILLFPGMKTVLPPHFLISFDCDSEFE